MKKLNPKLARIRKWFSGNQFFGQGHIKLIGKSLFLMLVVFLCFSGCKIVSKTDVTVHKLNLASKTIVEAGYNADSAVNPEIPAYEGTTITYKRDGKSILTVRREDLAVAGVVTKSEKWGFFQFPSIYRSQNNSVLVAKWNMAEDAVESYGKGENGLAISLMHIATDGSIIAGIYPGFYLNEKGGVDPSGILFYRSTDEDRTWKIRGRIPYEPNLKTDPNGDKRLNFGFTEPAFEILYNGTFLCVMRSSDSFVTNSPMYVSRSTDFGFTWTKPRTFTKADVLPRLLQLKNGVIVLALGRPGVQLRFCTDGKGQKWTDPFEMLPFKNEKESAVSCGYTQLLATGPDRFELIYSDYNYLIEVGTIRKAIKVREVIVAPI